MSSFGVVPEGFNPKSLEQVLSEFEDDQRAAFGAAVNVTPQSVFGQMNGIIGDKVAELWEVANATYSTQYPDTSQDASLDGVGSLTGAERLAATQSTVSLRLNLGTGTILDSGRVVSVDATGVRFVTTEQASNTTGFRANVTVAAKAEEFGPVAGFAGTIDTIETPVAGWTAQAAINSSLTEVFSLSDGQTLLVAVDGGADQTVIFATGDFVDIANATAEEVSDSIIAQTTGVDAQDVNGAVRVTSDTDGAGSAIQISGGSANPQLGFDTGLVAGMNDDDSTLGRDLETDQDFRIRREELLQVSGAGTLEAIRAAVRQVPNVTQAFAFENVTLVTNPDGLPGKSFEVVVSGGDDTAIAQAIFDSKGGGIESFRDPGPNGVTVAIEDSQGTSHDINFSRSTDVQMFTDVDVTVDGLLFGGGNQAAGEQQVKEAIATLGQQQDIGEDVTILRYQCEPLGVAGVLDVGLTEVDTVFPPTNTSNIVIGFRSLANFDTSDIRVFVTVA